MTTTKKYRWLKISLWSIGSLVAVMGLMHTPWGLALLRRVSGCPFTNVTAEDVEAARLDAVKKTRGTDPSKTQPALAFQLERTTLDELRSWAKDNGLKCEEKRDGAFFQCLDVPASALGPAVDGDRISDVSIGLRPATKVVVNVTTLRSDITAEQATTGMKSITSRLEEALGPPTTRSGDASPSFFHKPGMPVATVGYRFNDYMADVTATRLPSGRIVLREHYISALD